MRLSVSRPSILTVATVVSLLLAGCGGGSSSGSPTAAESTATTPPPAADARPEAAAAPGAGRQEGSGGKAQKKAGDGKSNSSRDGGPPRAAKKSDPTEPAKADGGEGAGLDELSAAILRRLRREAAHPGVGLKQLTDEILSGEVGSAAGDGAGTGLEAVRKLLQELRADE